MGWFEGVEGALLGRRVRCGGKSDDDVKTRGLTWRREDLDNRRTWHLNKSRT
jgi:hypothetical protein